MIELDGRSYIVDDPTTNAFNMLNYINDFMVENDVKNRSGETIQFKVSLASPMWLFCIGVGYIATVVQKIMYACAQAFNIGSCAELQVLNLAKIARLKRKEGSYTTIVTSVTASGGTCYITTSLEAKATYEGKEYTFKPVYNVTIANNATAEVVLLCTETGPVYINSGEITGFTTEPDNFGSMTSSSSQPGSGLETIESLRTRLMTNEAVSPLSGATQGLNALDGVSKAVVLYNSNYDSSMILAGKTVPPKRALVIVQGYSDKLAEEYFKHMSAQTFSDSTSHSMNYTMLNGQTFAFNYCSPVSVAIKVKINVKEAVTAEREAQIINAVAALSNTRQIGEDYTQSYILDSLNTNINFTEITGCTLSEDGGTTWGDTTSFNEGNIGLISSTDVSVVPPISDSQGDD